MLPMSENFLIDLSPSCTKEQAVLRLLGWGKETITKKYIKMSSAEKFEKDMKEISPIAINLHELLTETYREALQKYEDSFSEDPTEDELNTALKLHGSRILEAEEFISEAHGYLMDITDELARPDSALRIDQDATTKSGTAFITIRSLEEWAKNKYAKLEESSVKEELKNTEKSSGSTDDSSVGEKTLNSLYITLGLTARAIVELKGTQYGNPDKIVITQLAKLLEKDAIALSNDPNKPLDTQTYESIRKRLTEAQKRLRIATLHG